MNIQGPQPFFWVRYIDDILIQWPGSLDEFNTFFNKLIHVEDLIKLKVEWEQTLSNLAMLLSHFLIFSSNAPLLASTSQFTENLNLQISTNTTTHPIQSPPNEGSLLVSFLEDLGYAVLRLSLMRLNIYNLLFAD